MATVFPRLVPVLLPCLLFGIAGRIDLAFFWVFMAVYVCAMLAVLSSIDRELPRERVHPGYLAALGTCLSCGLVLGSWLSFVPLSSRRCLDVSSYDDGGSIPR